jgi:hypothetical protein
MSVARPFRQALEQSQRNALAVKMKSRSSVEIWVVYWLETMLATLVSRVYASAKLRFLSW